jgi:hypothetical protein
VRSGAGEALLAQDDGLDAEDVGLEVVGIGVVGACVGVGLVLVGVADGLDVGTGSCSGSHDCRLAAVAAPAAVAARLTPETAVSRRLPVTRATAAGRGCANRMKRLPLLLVTARNGSLTTASPTRLARRITAGDMAAVPFRLGTGGCSNGRRGIDERIVSL